MRLEPVPGEAGTIRPVSAPEGTDAVRLVDASAGRRVGMLAAVDAAAVVATATGAVWLARLGAAASFLAVLGVLLLLVVLLQQQLPSREPLLLDRTGATIRIVGAGVRVEWDAVERIDAIPGTRATSIVFRFRPGAAARGLLHPLGWRSEWLLRQEAARVRGVPGDAADAALAAARHLHRARLAQTARLDASLPPYSA
ncbi:hypothetical protein [Propionicicella superfundia]|uniref:hypothetical protein n=1 Tax=Propionicicella superfundia TaxID=348582 RepID=UPI0004917E9D|nr:hypothetical protein [Propionicicella superfundia]